MPARKKTEEPKVKRTVIRQRKGPIDPRKLDNEMNHAQRFKEAISRKMDELTVVYEQNELRIRQIAALRALPTLDIPNEGENI